MKAYAAWVERDDDDGIVISVPELGIVTDAERVADASSVAGDAVRGYLQTAFENGISVPAPAIEADREVVLVGVQDVVLWGDPIVFDPRGLTAA